MLVTSDTEMAARDAGKTASMVRQVDGTVIGTVVTRITDETNVDAVTDEVGERLLETIPEAPDAAEEQPMVLTAPDSDTDRQKYVNGYLERVGTEGAKRCPVMSARTNPILCSILAGENPWIFVRQYEPAEAYRRLASNLAVHVETADRNTPIYSPTATASGN